MAKRFFVGRIHEKTLENHMSESGKAFYTQYDNGYVSRGHECYKWLPCKLCDFGKPNELGWIEVKIPEWLFVNNRIDHRRCIDINWCGVEVR